MVPHGVNPADTLSFEGGGGGGGQENKGGQQLTIAWQALALCGVASTTADITVCLVSG